MSEYEYKEIIKQHLGVHDDDEKNGLDEVYRKADDFDELMAELEGHRVDPYIDKMLKRYEEEPK